MAVLDPLKLVIENYPEGAEELCEVPNHPQKPDSGKRQVPFSRELWIERDDFMEKPAARVFPPFPRQPRAAALRLRRRMHRYDRASDSVRCTYDADTKSGTPGRQSQGEGQYPLGQRQARVRRRAAALRPPASRCRIRRASKI
jgi:glutaminyl-tRNA synthetase